MLISIVSPVYKAANILPELVSQILKNVSTITHEFEIVLVDDGCPENSWDIMKQIANENRQIKAIKLSKNFGQHYAITAGLANAIGEWIIVMDCDLQDRPEEIVNLYNKTKEGYDIVLASRKVRNDRWNKRFFSWAFYKILSFLINKKIDETVANFGIYNKKVIAQIIKMKEQIRFFPTMVQWVGFKSTTIIVEHSKREEGKSNYNFKRLLKLGLDIILANSEKPILFVVRLGLIISSIAFIFGIINIVKYFLGIITEKGFTTLILSIWFLGGLVIMVLGILGLYIGKIFESVKDRPTYIIDKIINE